MNRRGVFSLLSLGLILAGAVYFFGSFYTEYGDPLTVMEESIALIAAGLVIRVFRPGE